jgi:hypothetical protein
LGFIFLHNHPTTIAALMLFAGTSERACPIIMTVVVVMSGLLSIMLGGRHWLFSDATYRRAHGLVLQVKERLRLNS